MNIYIKWFLIVVLNSILGFILGYTEGDINHLIGMISGVVTWYFLYLFLDIYLQKTGRKNISRKLVLSAIFRIPLQLTVIPDTFAGLGAIETVHYLGLSVLDSNFIVSYSKTIFTGLYLSLLCSIIYFNITFVDGFRNRRKNA
jgi:hypothetical protein